ncbi:hypothetical protein LTR56_017540 [Elasticomyces elasticus]|nr:hypothetical protein LTR22_022400 [Elasticomyces elasticus]KAK3630252.1 hypothetical protein LTR56_017540 [Elasticomyces elasticus]KAK4913910.1 hypothetical protein LTR49_017836 [Elasticomyces elasticus]KAK5766371.1 hypothetical protein LTS12_003583 [Elasticomyces elasticus]
MFTRSPLQLLRSWIATPRLDFVTPRLYGTSSRRPYTEEDDKLIWARRQENKTFKVIAAELNRTLGSVKRHVYNATRRKQGGTQPNRSRDLHTHEDINKARELIATGLPRRDVARHMGLSHGQLKAILDHTRSQRQAKHALSEADTANVISLRTEQKLSNAELARQTGWSYYTIQKIIYERFGGVSASSVPLPYTAAEDIDILKYRSQGLGYREIAALMLGRTPASIGDRFRNYLRDTQHSSSWKDEKSDVHVDVADDLRFSSQWKYAITTQTQRDYCFVVEETGAYLLTIRAYAHTDAPL